MKLVVGAGLVMACLAGPAWPVVAAEQPTATGKVDEAGKTVAVVDGQIITSADLDRELEVIRQRFSERGRQVTDEQLAEIRDEVLDRMIRRELLYKASRDQGVKVTGDEIDQGYQMVRARFTSDEDFARMMQQLRLSEDVLKRNIAREMAIKKLIDARFVQNTTVSDEEARQYYEKTKENFRQPESVHASHILIKVDESAGEEDKTAALKKIEDIRKQLQAGADFAELARKYSEGPSAAKGGDLGFFRRGQMVKPFEDAAFSTKVGDITDVVKTRFGYHIIKVHEKVEESTIPFEAISDRIKEYLKKEKIQKQVNSYIDSLKAKSTIKIM